MLAQIMANVIQKNRLINQSKVHVLAVGALIVLCSCSTTDVKPIGRDTYMIAGTRTGYSSGGEVLAGLYEKGYKYCADSQLSFVPVNEKSRDGVPGFRLASASIQFRCVPPDDPAANARPTLKKEPDVLIENSK